MRAWSGAARRTPFFSERYIMKFSELLAMLFVAAVLLVAVRDCDDSRRRPAPASHRPHSVLASHRTQEHVGTLGHTGVHLRCPRGANHANS